MKAARGPLRSVGGVLGAGLLRMIHGWTRVTLEGRDAVDDMIARHGSVIYALWHGRFILPAVGFGHEGTAVLVSLSEDGDLIAKVARRLGYRTARGSSSRGGKEGLLELQRELESGHNVALTPDGPRGPRHVAALGAVVLAARSGKPIVPLGADSRPCWELSSWDRFQIPRPLARASVVFGEALLVPPADDLEPYRRELEQRLVAVEESARSRGAGS